MSVEVTANVTVAVNVEIFYNISNPVKESALFTALRWSIQIYERKERVLNEYFQKDTTAVIILQYTFNVDLRIITE